MGGQAHVCLEGSKTTDFRKSGSPIVEWDVGISVPYSIPFQEIKLDIQLGSFMFLLISIRAISRSDATTYHFPSLYSNSHVR